MERNGSIPFYGPSSIDQTHISISGDDGKRLIVVPVNVW
jgi:hypothetical protein